MSQANHSEAFQALAHALIEAKEAGDEAAVEALTKLAQDPDQLLEVLNAEDEPVNLSAAHAPTGGVDVQGKHYPGGQFIPSDVMEKATPAEKAAVAGGGKPDSSKPDSSVDRSKQELSLHAPVKSKKALGGGVNATSIVKLHSGSTGVWKPAAGEAPGLRGASIEAGTYFRREAATAQVAGVLGFGDLVPATVMREVDGQHGSVQEFIPRTSAPSEVENSFNGREDLSRAAALDYITCNTDRHSGNWLLKDKPGLGERIKKWVRVPREGAKLVLIDHGLTFPQKENDQYMQTSDIIRESASQKIPDMSAIADKWPDVEKQLQASGIEEPAISLAKQRFDAIVKASAVGGTFGDLPYNGRTINNALADHPPGMRINLKRKGLE